MTVKVVAHLSAIGAESGHSGMDTGAEYPEPFLETEENRWRIIQCIHYIHALIFHKSKVNYKVAHWWKLSLNIYSCADNSANLRSYVNYTTQQESDKLIKLKLLAKSINSAFKRNVIRLFSSAVCGLSLVGRMFHPVIYYMTTILHKSWAIKSTTYCC